jgi:hypothetical protein
VIFDYIFSKSAASQKSINKYKEETEHRIRTNIFLEPRNLLCLTAKRRVARFSFGCTRISIILGSGYTGPPPPWLKIVVISNGSTPAPYSIK